PRARVLSKQPGECVDPRPRKLNPPDLRMRLQHLGELVGPRGRQPDYAAGLGAQFGDLAASGTNRADEQRLRLRQDGDGPRYWTKPLLHSVHLVTAEDGAVLGLLRQS